MSAPRSSAALARHKSLARGRSLAGVFSQVGVAHHIIEMLAPTAQRLGGDLDHDGIGALADIGGAIIEHHAPVGLEPDPHGRGVGQATYCRCRTTCRQRRRRAARALAASNARRACAFRPVRPQRFEAGGEAGDWLSIWPGAVASPARMALSRRNSRRSMPASVRKHVHQRLMGDCRLRHAEAAKGAGGRIVGEEARALRARTWGTR